MNDQIHEQLSALMDGELERDQTRFLLKRVAADNGLALRWTRYHVAQQVLRRQDVTIVAGFSEAVMARLDPRTATHAGVAGHWLRWGAGGAIAASVAVAALVLTRPVADVSGDAALVTRDSTRQAAGAAQVAAASRASTEFRVPLLAPSAPVETSPASFGSTGFGQATPIDPQVQPYLVRPYQTTGEAGQPDFVPYVLLVPPHVDAARAPSIEPGPGQQKY